jgi:hypothetical protein
MFVSSRQICPCSFIKRWRTIGIPTDRYFLAGDIFNYYLKSKPPQMPRRFITSFILLCLSMASNAQDNNTPIAAAKAWWHATTFGDTAYVNKHSTAGLTVTFNSGRSFTRSEIIAEVARYNPAARITSEWSDIAVQTLTPETAIVTNRIVETVGALKHVYKFITVLVSNDLQWKVAAVQSTRELQLASAVTEAEAGKLTDYAGSYRTSAGTILKILVKDNALVLVEPSGAETKLQAIASGLFEIPKILSAGNVRFAFPRVAAGTVTAMIRIAHTIVTMPRVE